jgi:hypothetical protein
MNWRLRKETASVNSGSEVANSVVKVRGIQGDGPKLDVQICLIYEAQDNHY